VDFELSIIICSWNTVDDLRRCLGCLGVCRDEARFEVIVIENNSQDSSAEMVEAEFPWVRLSLERRNLGFTGGNNRGLMIRRAKHVLMLNSDAFVHPGAIAGLMEHLRINPDLGIIGPKLLNEDGSLQYSCRRFPNPLAALFRNTPLGRLFPKNPWTRTYLMQDISHDEPAIVDWVSGAAMLVRGEAMDKLVELDPRFFMYCEDMDLCWRNWELGWKVGYAPQSVITHKIGTSTSKVPNRMVLRFHRSMMLFFRKHLIEKVTLPLRPFAFVLAFVGIYGRAGLFLVSNQVDNVRRKSRWI
jgi:GT2 family glycosyltransferase